MWLDLGQTQKNLYKEDQSTMYDYIKLYNTVYIYKLLTYS